MSIFVLAAIGGIGGGAVIGGWIEMNPHLGWRWIQWIQMMYVLCALEPNNWPTVEQVLPHLFHSPFFHERNSVRSAPHSPC